MSGGTAGSSSKKQGPGLSRPGGKSTDDLIDLDDIEMFEGKQPIDVGKLDDIMMQQMAQS